ncbi:MAG: hypothetical protein AAF602_23250 [Myxococcota bacterium]
MSGLEPLDVDELRIEPFPAPDGDVITCVWKGKSTHRYPGRVLEPWFEKLLNVASSQGATVKMRFDELLHFNSSTIGAIVQLIQQARARNVKLSMIYNGQQRWQRMSFEALKVFDKGDARFTLEKV